MSTNISQTEINTIVNGVSRVLGGSLNELNRTLTMLSDNIDMSNRAEKDRARRFDQNTTKEWGAKENEVTRTTFNNFQKVMQSISKMDKHYRELSRKQRETMDFSEDTLKNIKRAREELIKFTKESQQKTESYFKQTYSTSIHMLKEKHQRAAEGFEDLISLQAKQKRLQAGVNASLIYQSDTFKEGTLKYNKMTKRFVNVLNGLGDNILKSDIMKGFTDSSGTKIKGGVKLEDLSTIVSRMGEFDAALTDAIQSYKYVGTDGKETIIKSVDQLINMYSTMGSDKIKTMMFSDISGNSAGNIENVFVELIDKSIREGFNISEQLIEKITDKSLISSTRIDPLTNEETSYIDQKKVLDELSKTPEYLNELLKELSVYQKTIQKGIAEGDKQAKLQNNIFNKIAQGRLSATFEDVFKHFFENSVFKSIHHELTLLYTGIKSLPGSLDPYQKYSQSLIGDSFLNAIKTGLPGVDFETFMKIMGNQESRNNLQQMAGYNTGSDGLINNMKKSITDSGYYDIAKKYGLLDNAATNMLPEMLKYIKSNYGNISNGKEINTSTNAIFKEATKLATAMGISVDEFIKLKVTLNDMNEILTVTNGLSKTEAQLVQKNIEEQTTRISRKYGLTPNEAVQLIAKTMADSKKLLPDRYSQAAKSANVMSALGIDANSVNDFLRLSNMNQFELAQTPGGTQRLIDLKAQAQRKYSELGVRDPRMADMMAMLANNSSFTLDDNDLNKGVRNQISGNNFPEDKYKQMSETLGKTNEQLLAFFNGLNSVTTSLASFSQSGIGSLISSVGSMVIAIGMLASAFTGLATLSKGVKWLFGSKAAVNGASKIAPSIGPAAAAGGGIFASMMGGLKGFMNLPLKDKALMLGKGALKGGLTAGVGLGLDWGGDYLIKNDHEKLGAWSKVLGNTASGAGIGSFLGPWGALAGGLLGGAYGIYNNWDYITGKKTSQDFINESNGVVSPTKEIIKGESDYTAVKDSELLDEVKKANEQRTELLNTMKNIEKLLSDPQTLTNVKKQVASNYNFNNYVMNV